MDRRSRLSGGLLLIVSLLLVGQAERSRAQFRVVNQKEEQKKHRSSKRYKSKKKKDRSDAMILFAD